MPSFGQKVRRGLLRRVASHALKKEGGAVPGPSVAVLKHFRNARFTGCKHEHEKIWDVPMRFARLTSHDLALHGDLSEVRGLLPT